MLSQDPAQRGQRHRPGQPGGELGEQLRAGPAGQRHPGDRGQLAGQRDHRGPVRRADPPRPPRPRQVRQPVQAAGSEPAPPPACLVRADIQVRGDLAVRVAASGREHDLRPLPVPAGGLRAAGAAREDLPSGSGQGDRHRMRGHAPLKPELRPCNSAHPGPYSWPGQIPHSGTMGTCRPSPSPPAGRSPGG
jgi:hypothetical protein